MISASVKGLSSARSHDSSHTLASFVCRYTLRARPRAVTTAHRYRCMLISSVHVLYLHAVTEIAATQADSEYGYMFDSDAHD